MSRTILVVDHSPTVVKFVSFSLRHRGYNVVGASDGMDAIEKISCLSEDVDLVVTDLNMPNCDGYTLIETLRQNDRYRATPMIILTSEDGDGDREKGLAVGADSYLVKPFRSDRLLDEVARLLQ